MPSSTASWSEPVPAPPGRLPPGLNGGWTYRDRIRACPEGTTVAGFYAARYLHSTRAEWEARLAAGEVERNGRPLRADSPLVPGDRLLWRRPPWREEAVPASWPVLFDDGDLHVIAKPSGLPVLPAGGFLEHTLLRLLERRHAGDPAGIPRPVHRLGRFTSGLLVCARRGATRAWLSERLRESTGAAVGTAEGGEGRCRKTYRALVAPARLGLGIGASRSITVPIGAAPHPRLGRLWQAMAAAPDGAGAGGRPARSRVTLLERRPEADLVAVTIASGRPHQIRIHLAATGAPLLGDPLYLPGGGVRDGALPGEGGYRLHAHRLRLVAPCGRVLELEAPPPAVLRRGRRGPAEGTAAR
ncbi:MAG: RluA family pseudouridine synthase [Synechococcaceae cyanobacterium]|nr:RluA family pseudouridine synthase [Synechococcaceae cyanobacterium]